MSDLKEILLDDYYDFPVFKIIKIKDQYGSLCDQHEYPNPKIGKIYRNPTVNIVSSKTTTITTIIGIETKKVSYFEYAFSPEIKRLHIEESRILVIKENK